MTIPANLRTPFIAAEISNTNATKGPALQVYRGLLIGQKIAAGTATVDTLYLVTSATQVAKLAGRGSMLHGQARAWFAGNKFTELWIGVLADNGAGVAATGTVTFTGPATAAGTVSLYIGGQVVQVGVASGDTATTIATAFTAALPTASDFPVTGTNTAGVLTLTFRHKGLVGNDLDVRMNYMDGDVLPAGVTATVVAMASGTTAPTLTNLIAAMGDTQFHVVAHAYTDAASLTALETEFADRFGPIRQIDGALFAAKSDTLSNLATLGNSRNSPQSSIVGLVGFPTPSYEAAANVAGIAAYNGNADPGRPFQTLTSSWIKAPAQADLLQLTERNVLLFDGISTLTVADGGLVAIERLITTYKTNTAGAPDVSYLDTTTMLTLGYLRYSLRNQIRTQFPRAKLADDGTQFASGQVVVTPKILKAECVNWFAAMEALGLVENRAAFKAALDVQRDATDRNRVNFIVPPDLINQFIVGAISLNFVL